MLSVMSNTFTVRHSRTHEKGNGCKMMTYTGPEHLLVGRPGLQFQRLIDIAFSHARKVEAQPLVLKTFSEHSADLTRRKAGGATGGRK